MSEVKRPLEDGYYEYVGPQHGPDTSKHLECSRARGSDGELVTGFAITRFPMRSCGSCGFLTFIRTFKLHMDHRSHCSFGEVTAVFFSYDYCGLVPTVLHDVPSGAFHNSSRH